ncbi:3-dehydroquinate synthase [Rickettsiales bacterium]|nr:3-dehydroquinate synthase [Rickettsiales bacterium]
MNTEIIKVDLDKRSYNIKIGENIIENLANHLQEIGNFSKVFIITDSNVARFHLDKISSTLNKSSIEHKSIIIDAGEKTKNFQNLQNLCEKILSCQIDRNSLLIALGGGVIGDLVGFVASILLRGINFIQIPTTLLAAVDSSVGGKTAINSKFGKNLIGSFYQPKIVICDIKLLDTLPQRDFISGYGEVIKYGLIYDSKFFDYLKKNLSKIQDRDSKIIQNIIATSCKIKAKIVSEDEKEHGKRALLNFGHTFGHVFENQTNYSEELFHGEAVAIGMVLAAQMSLKLNLIDIKQLESIKQHIKKSGLFTHHNQIRENWDENSLIESLYKDKKVKNNKLTFILLHKIGKAIIKDDISEDLFLKIIRN